MCLVTGGGKGGGSVSPSRGMCPALFRQESPSSFKGLFGSPTRLTGEPHNPGVTPTRTQIPHKPPWRQHTPSGSFAATAQGSARPVRSQEVPECERASDMGKLLVHTQCGMGGLLRGHKERTGGILGMQGQGGGTAASPAQLC